MIHSDGIGVFNWNQVESHRVQRVLPIHCLLQTRLDFNQVRFNRCGNPGIRSSAVPVRYFRPEFDFRGWNSSGKTSFSGASNASGQRFCSLLRIPPSHSSNGPIWNFLNWIIDAVGVEGMWQQAICWTIGFIYSVLSSFIERRWRG